MDSMCTATQFETCLLQVNQKKIVRFFIGCATLWPSRHGFWKGFVRISKSLGVKFKKLKITLLGTNVSPFKRHVESIIFLFPKLGHVIVPWKFGAKLPIEMMIDSQSCTMKLELQGTHQLFVQISYYNPKI